MRLLSTAIALCALSLASPASAQSGYDTGAGRSPKATTNSGMARPDTTGNSAAGRVEAPSDVAGPTTSSSGASGERGARPDAKPANMPQERKEAGSKRAAPTQTDD